MQLKHLAYNLLGGENIALINDDLKTIWSGTTIEIPYIYMNRHVERILTPETFKSKDACGNKLYICLFDD